MGLIDGMTCSESVSTSKVYDEKRKEYIVKKEVIGVSFSRWLGINPTQLKECISPFIAKYYDVKVMDYALKVWKWGMIDELDSNGVFPTWISTHLLSW